MHINHRKTILYLFGVLTVSLNRLQFATACCSTSTTSCEPHPTSACNNNQIDCEKEGGRHKCNKSGSYSWFVIGSTPGPTALVRTSNVFCLVAMAYYGVSPL